MKVSFKLNDDINLSAEFADTDQLEATIAYFRDVKRYLEDKGLVRMGPKKAASKECRQPDGPTEKQLAILDKFSIPHDDSLTREGASKLIEESIKRSRQ